MLKEIKMDTKENIDNREAKESLEMVSKTCAKTQKVLASSYASPMLILWGLLWMLAYTLSHFYGRYSHMIFNCMAATGGIGSAIIMYWYKTGAPLKDDSSNSVNKKIFWFWMFLAVYVGVWLSLLAPFDGLRANAFIATTVMFAYIVMGLFFESTFMIILGIGLTVTTLIGCFLLTPYYCLWMAATGGGGLFITGVYIRLRWR